MKRMHSYKMAFNLYLQNALREIKTQHTVRNLQEEEKGAGEGADDGADLPKWAACLAKQHGTMQKQWQQHGRMQSCS